MEEQTMTQPEALEWVRDHDDDGPMDETELAEVFEALYERKPDIEDMRDGLWNLVCEVAR
jgi:hypothetical protein